MVPEPYPQGRSHAAICLQSIWHKFPDLINREAVYCFETTLVNLSVRGRRRTPALPAYLPRSRPWYRASFVAVVARVLVHELPGIDSQVLGRLQSGEHRGNDHNDLAAVRVRELAAKRCPARRDVLQESHECAAVVHLHLRERRAPACTAFILQPQQQPVRARMQLWAASRSVAASCSEGEGEERAGDVRGPGNSPPPRLGHHRPARHGPVPLRPMPGSARNDQPRAHEKALAWLTAQTAPARRDAVVSALQRQHVGRASLTARSSSNQPATRSEGCGVSAARRSRRRRSSNWRSRRPWPRAAFRSAGNAAA